jgi:hypothetical protein
MLDISLRPLRALRLCVRHTPPPPGDVSVLMFDLLDWWNSRSDELSPLLSSAILHYRFEAIHPFADGNGRTGRAFALWAALRVSRQGAMDLLRPMIEAGLVEKIGGKKTGRYSLRGG